MKRYLAAIMCIGVLCATGCSQQEETTAETVQPIVSTEMSVHQEEQVKEQEPEEVEVQGSVSFADAGELDSGQQQLITDFLDRYYRSLAEFSMVDFEELFLDDALAQIELERQIWNYQITVRSMQNTDLHLNGYSSRLWVDSMEEQEDQTVQLRLSEDSVQNFVQYPDVEAKTDDLTHIFTLKQEDGSWKIVSHMTYDRLYWSLPEDFRQLMRSATDDAQIIANIQQNIEQITADLEENLTQREQDTVLTMPQATHSYDREAAVAYARQWAADRNEQWADYSMNGGNCQNFVSQCLYAGGIPMDIQGDYVWKWYGDTPDSSARATGRSASWSGVNEFLEYVQNNTGSGMVAVADAPYDSGEVGDVLLLGFNEENFYHAVIITDVITDEDGRVIDYLIHSNTINEEDYPVSAYGYTCQLLVKICGWN